MHPFWPPLTSLSSLSPLLTGNISEGYRIDCPSLKSFKAAPSKRPHDIIHKKPVVFFRHPSNVATAQYLSPCVTNVTAQTRTLRYLSSDVIQATYDPRYKKADQHAGLCASFHGKTGRIP